MNDRTRNLTVGVTTLAGVIGLGVLLFLFGYIPAFLRGGYLVTIDMEDAVALNEGSAVQLYGIRIGQVRDIDFKMPPGTGIRVTARIRDGVRIPDPVHAEVDTDLLGGTATVQLVPENGSATATTDFLPDDGTALIPGQLGSLAGAFSQLNRLTTSFERFSQEWDRVGRNVNALLGDAQRAKEANLTDTGVFSVLTSLEERLAEMQAVLNDIRAYTNDEQLREKIDATLANAQTVSDNAVKTSETVDALVTDAGKKVDELTKRYLTLAQETSATMQQARAIMEVAQKGEGTLGRMLNDPALFESFADAALRIGALADEAKLLVQKWKAEGLPVQF